jgi:hypothetical protein
MIMALTIIIWASLICGIVWREDALITQAVILACSKWIVSEIRDARTSKK